MEPKVDFSKFSKVQASLKERLMAKYDEKQQLADDELDMVAAAYLGPSHTHEPSHTYEPSYTYEPSHTWQQRHKDRGIRR
ncbi:MAG: hypothetical protein SOV95_06635 [Anaerovibrio sp.]|uniref:hypothetical protein n=1 Tax=Anaerovibrio sp. TaxID=1872532 RepID=UPI00260B77CE|nr:hypothetical protein [Anaerovibrio sp.]MDD7677408.1 hypothetical protein [Anaerovibrio sp.]MDY2603931.1 hypothetical protein [Anaerovibrio sp.]